MADRLALVLLRQDRTAFVGLSSSKSKAILATLRYFHPQRCPRLSTALDPGLPDRAVHKVVVARLPLVPAAPPAPVRQQPVNPVAHVVACRCVAGEELTVTAREGLALVTELFQM